MTWKNGQEQPKNSEHKPQAEWEKKLEFLWRNSLQKGQNYFRQHTKKLLKYTFALLAFGWLVSGIYIVDQGNRGVVTRFGGYSTTTLPGPHWHIPFPIEQVENVNVEKQRFIEVGYRSNGGPARGQPALPESLMLTKDENIISVRLAIQYQIKDARDYLFKVKNNEATLKQVTESIERGVIGRNTMDFILTEGRSQIVNEIKDQVQLAMDQYQTGLRVASVNLQDAQPPEQVQDSFEDAIRAREDKQRLINEAEGYSNEVIPKSRGAAGRIIKEAEAYEAQIIAKAEGESQRFEQLLVQYEKKPSITRKRLYLEAKEQLYSHTNKVLVNMDKGSSNFYLPLNQMNQHANTQQPSNSSQGTNSNSGVQVKSSNNASRTNIRSSRSSRL
ncbi:MAG: FtsH protease activity modulator HflK [Methyloprofundus sp.]|nr:FtsH protease activity modulator HflK [Methyloprofundus sp.]MDT8424344.1 FtsH protease activity modulator HflK [Methyloprofundus sp.]